MKLIYNKNKFKALPAKFRQLENDLTNIAGREAVNFSKQSFRQQGWSGDSQEPWKPRKRGGKKNKGRAILVNTGKLMRATRVITTAKTYVIIGNDMPYAKAHNEGFNGTVNIPEHNRISRRTVITRYNKNGVASKSKNARKKIRGAEHRVKAHTRKMNIPKRQFMGASPYLAQKIVRIIHFKIKQII